MKDIIWKYVGLVPVLAGAFLMVLLAYYLSPYLRVENLGLSLGILLLGLLLFTAGVVSMGKYDEDFMEKVLDKVGKVLKYF